MKNYNFNISSLASYICKRGLNWRLKKKEAAYQTLSDALALSDDMGMHREVWKMCWALGQLEAERGNESVAVQLKERAQIEALCIADHAGTLELRECFLSRPDLQLILAA